MIELTSTLLRSLVTPIGEGVVVSGRDGGVVSGMEDIFEEYLGIKVPKRLVKWFKSPARSESFLGLFEENGTECGFEYNRVKKGVQFWVQRSDRGRRYLSGVYSGVNEAYSDLSFLCTHLCGKGVDLSEIGIKLTDLKEKYIKSMEN